MFCMAIINCPECNKEVSDKAQACPNCGFGIVEFIERKEKIEQIQAESEREAYHYVKRIKREQKEQFEKEKKAEEDRKSQIYSQAVDKFNCDSSQGVSEAQKMFATIKGWKDADIYYVNCSDKIADLKEMELIRAAKNKKIATVSIVTSIILIIICICVNNFIVKPQKHIHLADSYIEASNFEQADKEVVNAYGDINSQKAQEYYLSKTIEAYCKYEYDIANECYIRLTKSQFLEEVELNTALLKACVHAFEESNPTDAMECYSKINIIELKDSDEVNAAIFTYCETSLENGDLVKIPEYSLLLEESYKEKIYSLYMQYANSITSDTQVTQELLDNITVLRDNIASEKYIEVINIVYANALNECENRTLNMTAYKKCKDVFGEEKIAELDKQLYNKAVSASFKGNDHSWEKSVFTALDTYSKSKDYLAAFEVISGNNITEIYRIVSFLDNLEANSYLANDSVIQKYLSEVCGTWILEEGGYGWYNIANMSAALGFDLKMYFSKDMYRQGSVYSEVNSDIYYSNGNWYYLDGDGGKKYLRFYGNKVEIEMLDIDGTTWKREYTKS